MKIFGFIPGSRSTGWTEDFTKFSHHSCRCRLDRLINDGSTLNRERTESMTTNIEWFKSSSTSDVCLMRWSRKNKRRGGEEEEEEVEKRTSFCLSPSLSSRLSFSLLSSVCMDVRMCVRVDENIFVLFFLPM